MEGRRTRVVRPSRYYCVIHTLTPIGTYILSVDLVACYQSQKGSTLLWYTLHNKYTATRAEPLGAPRRPPLARPHKIRLEGSRSVCCHRDLASCDMAFFGTRTSDRRWMRRRWSNATATLTSGRKLKRRNKTYHSTEQTLEENRRYARKTGSAFSLPIRPRAVGRADDMRRDLDRSSTASQTRRTTKITTKNQGTRVCTARVGAADTRHVKRVPVAAKHY